MPRPTRLVLLLVLIGAATGCGSRRPTVRPVPPRTPQEIAAGDTSSPARTGQRPLRPYDRVITTDARTQRGLFIVHREGERLYFEIPRAELGRDMLLLRRAAAGQATTGSQVVRWERRGNRVLLRERAFNVAADTMHAISRAVATMTEGVILAAFDLETWGPDSAAVIDATRLFTTNITGVAAVNGVVPDRTFLETALAFESNIEVEATQTGIAPPQPAFPGVPPTAGARPETRTVRAHWSLLRLPETPMMPRLHDRRVGWFHTTVVDYGRPEHEAVSRRYIHRFRLEKKDPDAEVSEPVKPIVYWIDPATPGWLVPWMRAAVEEWRPAFEAAGFRNAIEARIPPPNDSTWSMHDARHSVIYWRPSTVANATGTQIVDPRSGEILRAEVNMYHNILSLMRSWYFIQASPLDPRARTFPFPDSLMGRLVQNVVAHEVGHSLGFPHNHKASSLIPADSVRSAAFVQRMGHSPSVMDYARFNYVAQPEDGIPLESLVPRVGPYDRFAVMWGHKPIPGASTPDDELPTLERWASAQDTAPYLRFSTEGAFNDPGDQTEAIGDADAVKSSTLALRNLERVAEWLLPAAEQPGRDYTLVRELYDETVAQWGRYMGHVASAVGGADSQERYGTGPRFTPLSRERQREAVRFLTRNAFTVPSWFTDRELLRRLEPAGGLARVRSAQTRVLNSLFAESRLGRLIEYEATAASPDEAYTIADLLTDLRAGVWTELENGRPRINVYRRNLQRAYLDAAGRLLSPPAGATSGVASDARALVRGELVELRSAIRAAIPRAADANTRLHLTDLELEIGRVLEPDR